MHSTCVGKSLKTVSEGNHTNVSTFKDILKYSQIKPTYTQVPLENKISNIMSIANSQYCLSFHMITHCYMIKEITNMPVTDCKKLHYKFNFIDHICILGIELEVACN